MFGETRPAQFPASVLQVVGNKGNELDSREKWAPNMRIDRWADEPGAGESEGWHLRRARRLIGDDAAAITAHGSRLWRGRQLCGMPDEVQVAKILWALPG